MNNNLYIVTVATELKYYMKYLIESIKNNNGELVILGYGEEWKGFNWKFKMTIEFLKKVNPNDIVCFVDGYDVVCTRNLDELIETFKNVQKRENCKIIVGNDRLVDPTYNIFTELYFGKCKNEFINTGTYIGYAKDILEVLEFIHKDNFYDDQDDQILLINYCNLKPNNIYIDTQNEIFLVLVNSFKNIKKDITYDNKQLIYKQTSKPFFVHAPASTYLDDIIINTGCNHLDGNKIQNDLYIDFWNKKIYFLIIHIIKQKIEFIIILILLIIIIYFIIKSKKN